MSLITTTVREFLEESAPGIGKDPNSCEALYLLNSARRLLWSKDWEGTVDFGCAPITSSCIILPSKFSSIREAWVGVDGNIPARMENSFYWSIGTNLLDECCNNSCDPPKVTKNDTRIIFPSMTKDCLVTFQLTEVEDDNGVDLSVSYIDNNNSRVSESTKLTEESPSYTTQYKVRRFNGVSKKNASGPVEVIQNGLVVDVIPAYESSPACEVYRVIGGSYTNLVIKAKLKYYKYEEKSLSQYLDLNPDALLFAMQAVQVRDSGSNESNKEYIEKLQLAEGHLELAQRADNPGFGSALPSENYPKIGVSV